MTTRVTLRERETVASPEQTRTAMQARLDGQVAAIRKEAFTTNPHGFGTNCSRAWSRGYREVKPA